jgi:hypothetical protein
MNTYEKAARRREPCQAAIKMSPVLAQLKCPLDIMRHCYSASTYKESTDTGYISRFHLGAFFAPQKTGLCGGSVPSLHGVTAPRPSNPLRTNRQHPKG